MNSKPPRKKKNRVDPLRSLTANTPQQPPSALLSDRPIVSAGEDQLGLQPFAATLARSLRQMAPAEGMVISLHAPWGSGKTSALNLIQRHLAVLDISDLANRSVDEISSLAAARPGSGIDDEKKRAKDWTDLAHHHHANRKTTVIRFNPWYFSGQENLFKAFFGVLGTELSISNDTAVAKAVGAVLKRGSEAGAAFGAGVGLLVAGPAGAAGGATIAGLFGKLVGDKFDKKQSLEASLQDLRTALQTSDKRIVVIIDDMDRLMPDELRHMLTLVKSLGNLPNITYLVAYDQSEVIKLLKLSGIDNVDYLEKIVQVSFELPNVDRYALRSMLFGKLDPILGGETVGDQRRWAEAFFLHIDPYIQTPRDITRLTNALHVVWPAVKGEVDWSDLVTLETLRMHEPKLYAIIQEKLDLLTGEEHTWKDDKEWAKPLLPTLETAKMPDTATATLSYLFPRLGRAWGKSSSSATEYEDRRLRRLRSKHYARNYFALSQGADQFSKSDIRHLFDTADPTSAFDELLTRAQHRKTRKGLTMVSRLIEQMTEEVSESVPLRPALAKLIFQHADTMMRVRDVERQLWSVDNRLRLDWLLVTALRARPLAERADTFIAWLPCADGIVFAAPLVESLTGEKAQTSGDDIFPKESFDRLRHEITLLIRKAAKTTNFLTLCAAPSFLFAWARLTNYAEVSAWLSTAIADDQDLINFAAIVPSEITSSNEGVYFTVDERGWSHLVAINDIVARLAALPPRIATDPANVPIIQKFNTALERGRRGD